MKFKALIKQLSEAMKTEGKRIAILKAVKSDRKTEDGRVIFKVPGSTISLDRADEILIPLGCNSENYQKNPVILLAHDYAGESYGKTIEMEITEDAVNFDFVFSNDETGRRLEEKYSDGVMSAFSVSFLPTKEVPVTDAMEGEIEILVGGKTVKLNLNDYPRRPRNIVTDWELLELSVCAVPCNQDAVKNSAKALADDLKKRIKNQSPVKAFKESEIDRLLKNLNDTVDKLLNVDAGVKAAVPIHSTPINTEMDWNGDEALINLARGASEDGSGDKEKLDFAKFAQGFAWFDENSAMNLTSYKLPHHIFIESELVAIWRGVVAAMAALFGARGGVDIPDDQRRATYDHLAAHFQDNGVEPPEFRAYTEDELKKLFPELYPEENDETEDDGTEDDSDKSAAIQDLTMKIDALTGQVAKIAEAVANIGVKAAVIYDSILSLKSSHKDGKEGDDDGVSKALKALNEKINDLIKI